VQEVQLGGGHGNLPGEQSGKATRRQEAALTSDPGDFSLAGLDSGLFHAILQQGIKPTQEENP
jgi:hypothetical protein